MKDALIIKGNQYEQKRRMAMNDSFEEMRKRGIYTEDTVRNYLLNQIDTETYGGYLLTYDEAMTYYKELNSDQ